MVANFPGRRKFLAVLLLGVVPLSGCNGLWDDITSREFSFRDQFGPAPDPLVVLRDSKDGDRRHTALKQLGEIAPATLPPQEAESILKVLITAAGSERHVWARIAAVQALGNWDDPRAVEGLKDAYYRSGLFPGDGGARLKVEALTSLGRCGNPAAVEILIKVLSEPPDVGSVTEQQQKLEERLAAVRALGRYKSSLSTETLLQVLRNEQDPGLRNRARESLVRITGRDLPAEADTWERYLRDPSSVPEKTFGERVLEILPVGGRRE